LLSITLFEIMLLIDEEKMIPAEVFKTFVLLMNIPFAPITRIPVSEVLSTLFKTVIPSITTLSALIEITVSASNPSIMVVSLSSPIRERVLLMTRCSV